MSNPNTIYANAFVDSLVAAGLKRVCIAPGSRSTPLVLAFARHGDAIDIHSHLDERSAAFFALGMALATGEASALVCTSGSAAANFLPAIVEARQSQLPLLILSADRPHELRHSGANQTIDQLKLFGDQVVWFVDAPLPEANPPAIALRNMRTLAARALATTGRGPVHINLPFRKPFEPDGDESRTIDRRPPTRITDAAQQPPTLDDLLTAEALNGKGLIAFCHGSCRDIAEAEALSALATRLSRLSGFPVLAEFTSNMRGATGDYQPLLAYESVIGADGIDLSELQTLIRIGEPPLSKALADAIAGAELEAHIVINRRGAWADDTHSATQHVTLEPALLAEMPLDEREPVAGNAAFRDRLQAADAIARRVIRQELARGEYFDGAAVFDAVDLMPDGGIIFAGNSLPVRHIDQFGDPGTKRLLALANRGASGIDGNLSTALGAGAALPDSPLAAIVGDITFYHDMNGLLAVRRCGVPMTILLLNNGGGGIFQRLPIRAFEPSFSDYFITAHGLDFAHAARLYGLEYTLADDREALRRAFGESISRRESAIIELRTDALSDLRRRNEIMAAVRTAVTEEIGKA